MYIFIYLCIYLLIGMGSRDWGPVSLKCVGGLGTQAGVHPLVLTVESAGQLGRLETQAGVLYYSLGAECLLLGEILA